MQSRAGAVSMWISHENRAEYSFFCLSKKEDSCAILLARVPTTTQDAQASQQHATFALEKNKWLQE